MLPRRAYGRRTDRCRRTLTPSPNTAFTRHALAPTTHLTTQGKIVPAKDRFFITGASGFVGSAVGRELSRAGFALRALVRAGSPRGNLDGLDTKIVVGDMRDARAVCVARHAR